MSKLALGDSAALATPIIQNAVNTASIPRMITTLLGYP